MQHNMTERRRAVAAQLLEKHTASFIGVPRASGHEVVALREQGRQVVLIDVRTLAERAVSMLPDAISAPEFENLCISSPERFRGAVLVPYCTIGYRSGVYCRRLQAGEFLPGEELDVRNGDGVVMWSHDVGQFEGGARRVHVYGAAWDVAAEGFETLRFDLTGNMLAAISLIASWMLLIRIWVWRRLTGQPSERKTE